MGTEGTSRHRVRLVTPPVLRTVRLEPAAQVELDAADKQYLRLSEMWRGTEWTLCRKPEDGTLISLEDDIYLYKVDPPITEAPIITVLFQYDEQLVKVLGIKVEPRDYQN